MKKHLKNQVIPLREQGKTYSEIRVILKTYISNGTLSLWCKNVVLPPQYKDKIAQLARSNFSKARKKAIETNRQIREQYLKNLLEKNSHIKTVIRNKDSARVALAMLYLGEGSKNPGSLTFCNSNPLIIQLFLYLLRYCYVIDESKFRCTVQCRADQNTNELKKYWSALTTISEHQFIKPQIDSRTIGKPTKQPNYKGVCRISYFSAQIFIELQQIAYIIHFSMNTL